MFNVPDLKKAPFIVLLSALSLTGIGLLLLSTSKWGVILEMDSARYLLFAQFLEDHNVSEDIVAGFLSHLQPLFPIVLSWGDLIKISPLEAARWLNSMLFGFNILLTGVITKKYTRSAWMGLSAALLLFGAPDILEIHLTAMSEPLFIFFMLIWLLLFLDYLKNPKVSVLILSSLIVALASMTRFAGLPMAVTGLFAILFLNREKNLVNKISYAAIFVSISCFPVFFWARSIYIHTKNSPAQRYLAFHPINSSYFQDMVSVFCSWFLPPNIDVPANEKIFLFAVGTALSFIGLLLWGRAKKTYRADPEKTVFMRFSVLGMTFICSYIAGLILTALFYDADTYHCLTRLLIPVHIMGLILFCGFMMDFFKERSSSFKKNIGKMIITCLILFYIIGSAPYLMRQYYLGDNFANDPFRFSYIIRKIKALPAGAPIYTNDFITVYILAGKSSFIIPATKNIFSLRENNGYSDQLSRMMADLQKNKGILVYFNKNEQKFIEPIENLQKRMPLHLIAQDNNASIFDAQ